MFSVLLAQLFHKLSFWMFREIIHGEDSAFLSSEGQLIVQLINALPVKVTFCHEYERLCGDQAKHESVYEADAVIHQEEPEKRQQNGVLNLFGPLSFLFPLATFQDRELVVD